MDDGDGISNPALACQQLEGGRIELIDGGVYLYWRSAFLARECRS